MKGWIAGLALCCAASLAACSANQTPQEVTGPVAGPKGGYDPNDSIFGEGGVSIGRLADGSIFGSGKSQAGDAMPVNRFLWQASLDTLDFLPLESTDPFTGVIATDWSATPDAPDERLKVTVYMVSPQLAASSLRVALFREKRTAEGGWAPIPTSAETARRLEDAILTRARQLRIAAFENGQG